jgi:hypothetical protein
LVAQERLSGIDKINLSVLLDCYKSYRFHIVVEIFAALLTIVIEGCIGFTEYPNIARQSEKHRIKRLISLS